MITAYFDESGSAELVGYERPDPEATRLSQTLDTETIRELLMKSSTSWKEARDTSVKVRSWTSGEGLIAFYFVAEKRLVVGTPEGIRKRS